MGQIQKDIKRQMNPLLRREFPKIHIDRQVLSVERKCCLVMDLFWGTEKLMSKYAALIPQSVTPLRNNIFSPYISISLRLLPYFDHHITSIAERSGVYWISCPLGLGSSVYFSFHLSPCSHSGTSRVKLLLPLRLERLSVSQLLCSVDAGLVLVLPHPQSSSDWEQRPRQWKESPSSSHPVTPSCLPQHPWTSTYTHAQ